MGKCDVQPFLIPNLKRPAIDEKCREVCCPPKWCGRGFRRCPGLLRDCLWSPRTSFCRSFRIEARHSVCLRQGLINPCIFGVCPRIVVSVRDEPSHTPIRSLFWITAPLRGTIVGYRCRYSVAERIHTPQLQVPVPTTHMERTTVPTLYQDTRRMHRRLPIVPWQ